ncbi:hypothetical protein JG688_00012122 [Phytophthora aleatoria]|uniref:LRRK2 ARM repeat domain-containing protein n=1 Tax=Phytophthora aleatoria TaxID=2496075 RepID=A0A8J5MEG9_9STRA|nr:hypothetical protein JG688_00012122 [Phytophthora aleatoria]
MRNRVSEDKPPAPKTENQRTTQRRARTAESTKGRQLSPHTARATQKPPAAASSRRQRDLSDSVIQTQTQVTEILEAITSIEADAVAVKNSLSLLLRVIRSAPQITAECIHEQKGELLLLETIQTHSSHAVLLCYGCVLMRKLCHLSVESVELFVQHGIIPTVAQALLSFPEDAILQASACGCLAVLTQTSDASKNEMLAMNDPSILRLVLASLEIHREYSNLTRQLQVESENPSTAESNEVVDVVGQTVDGVSGSTREDEAAVAVDNIFENKAAVEYEGVAEVLVETEVSEIPEEPTEPEAAVAGVEEEAVVAETEVSEIPEEPTEPEAAVAGVEEEAVVAEVRDAVEQALQAVSEAASETAAEAVTRTKGSVTTVMTEMTDWTVSTEATDFIAEAKLLFDGDVISVSKKDKKDRVVALKELSPDDAELETEVAATAQELVNAVEAQATPSHVVSAAAVTSAVIGTLLGLIDTVELELEGSDDWDTSAMIHPALEEAENVTTHLSPRDAAKEEQAGSTTTPLKLDVNTAVQFSPYRKAQEDVLPELSDDAVRDADFVELIRLPEPSPAELSAAAVGVAVVGALLDVVDALDIDL